MPPKVPGQAGYGIGMILIVRYFYSNFSSLVQYGMDLNVAVKVVNTFIHPYQSQSSGPFFRINSLSHFETDAVIFDPDA